MIEIGIGWLFALIGVAGISVGLLLAVMAGASRDVQDMRMAASHLRDEVTHFAQMAESAKKLSEEMREANEQCKEEISKLQTEKRELAMKYIQVQNEAAWFRMQVKDIAPDTYIAVKRAQERAKRMSGGLNESVQNSGSGADDRGVRTVSGTPQSYGSTQGNDSRQGKVGNRASKRGVQEDRQKDKPFEFGPKMSSARRQERVS